MLPRTVGGLRILESGARGILPLFIIAGNSGPLPSQCPNNGDVEDLVACSLGQFWRNTASSWRALQA